MTKKYFQIIIQPTLEEDKDYSTFCGKVSKLLDKIGTILEIRPMIDREDY